MSKNSTKILGENFIDITQNYTRFNQTLSFIFHFQTFFFALNRKPELEHLIQSTFMA